jgi:hypothetical protein
MLRLPEATIQSTVSLKARAREGLLSQHPSCRGEPARALPPNTRLAGVGLRGHSLPKTYLAGEGQGGHSLPKTYLAGEGQGGHSLPKTYLSGEGQGGHSLPEKSLF